MIDVHGTDPWNVDESRCGFIRTCHKENIGWYALALCILGADHYEVLQTFCGIHTNIDNKNRKHRERKDVVLIDIDKLRNVMKARNISQRKLAEVTKCSRTVISTMFSAGRKRKVWVDRLEKSLHLPNGALIKKEGTK